MMEDHGLVAEKKEVVVMGLIWKDNTSKCTAGHRTVRPRHQYIQHNPMIKA